MKQVSSCRRADPVAQQSPSRSATSAIAGSLAAKVVVPKPPMTTRRASVRKMRRAMVLCRRNLVSRCGKNHFGTASLDGRNDDTECGSGERYRHRAADDPEHVELRRERTIRVATAVPILTGYVRALRARGTDATSSRPALVSIIVCKMNACRANDNSKSPRLGRTKFMKNYGRERTQDRSAAGVSR